MYFEQNSAIISHFSSSLLRVHHTETRQRAVVTIGDNIAVLPLRAVTDVWVVGTL